MNKNLLKILVIICFFALLSPLFVLAKGTINSGVADLRNNIAVGAGFNTKDNPAIVIGNTIGLALGLVGIIFLILMVYGGFLWMTARGESEPVEKAQKIIKAAVIGIIIVMSAYAITMLVTGRLSGGGSMTAKDNGGGLCTGETGVLQCGDLAHQSCVDGACISDCQKKYPMDAFCGHTSECPAADGEVETGLCPGAVEPDPTKDNVCCHIKK